MLHLECGEPAARRWEKAVVGNASSGKGWVRGCGFCLYPGADPAPFFLSCAFQAHEFTAVLELEKGSVCNWGVKSILVKVIKK